jgi:hypothetical protein
MTSTFKMVSKSVIEQLESKFQIQLPSEYFDFLEKHNGGFIQPCRFEINSRQGKSTIDIFYGIMDIGSSYEHLDLENNFSKKILLMPEEIYPIGNDPGGNYICLCMKGDNYGKVYFFDHEEPNEEANGSFNWDNLYHIADSFNAFLQKLH